MLETIGLTKIYKPKKGVPVKALDNVSIKFPDKGMVFLLGKSGSGKSTLLNLLGGLDKYDGGEIIIKDVSSKNFKQKHFDSYRNTYVGFIFQEYNVLDEFSVGANIALAIELQGKRADDERINKILHEVDLDGFGARKPNELSGGQKQRVAIARALVKNPEIIMADEPTGALDSNTGKQIFDTLKKLSRDKLVLVVSHDREFAERYADRIIELADGVVISDTEIDTTAESVAENGLSYEGNSITVPEDYRLTEADRNAINDYMDKLKSGKISLNVSGKVGNAQRFKPTDVSKIVAGVGTKFSLIKSKLPLKNAFKIGAGALKYKKFRLVMTVLLSVVAFSLFGLSDTFGAYDHIKTCTNSLIDSETNYISVGKSVKVGEGERAYWQNYEFFLSDDELKDIAENTGDIMTGVYCPPNTELSFASNVKEDTDFGDVEFNIYRTSFSGFAEISEDVLKNLNIKLIAGRIPDGTKNEIAISEYACAVFKKMSYTDGSTTTDKDGKVSINYQQISGNNEMLGKILTVDNVKYTVVGIVDTGFDIERYEGLMEEKVNTSNSEQIIDYILYNEFSTNLAYSFSGVIMTGDGFVDNMLQYRPPVYPTNIGAIWFWGEKYDVNPKYLSTLSRYGTDKIIWRDGAKTQLADNEVIVTSDSLNFYEEDFEYTEDASGKEKIDYAATLKKLEKLSLSGYIYGVEDNSYNTEDVTVVGIIPTNEQNSKWGNTVICSENVFDDFCAFDNGKYSFAVGRMPEEKSDVEKTVTYCYDDENNTRFPIQNSVTYELDSINEELKEFSKIFLYIGLAFALFAALMLSNFIATSISYKKQEIGILRAIGSRSNDVFRIFFAESFVIAMINFLLSCIGVFAATTVINHLLRSNLGILITILNFDIRQILLLFAVSTLVAFVASFIPVKRIASKRPIDAIRDR